MCKNGTEENKRRYKSMKNKAKKSLTEKTEEALTELQNCSYVMLRLVRGQKLIAKNLKEEGV